MWASVAGLMFIFLLHTDAFVDWSVDELAPVEKEPLFTAVKNNAPKLSARLNADKDWKKAREEAQVKPFAGKVKSYSGFFTVDEKYDSNMFFWFFPSERRPAKRPVILWLHGGPGQSSVMGLFEESGPYKIVKGSATLRDTSWSKRYNLLYLDNPIGAGYSYANDSAAYSRTIDEAVVNLYEAVAQFYKMFPQYRKNAFYVVGQSYGGKYIPPLALKIDQKNKEKGAQKINLKGALIGCGCLDPVNQIAFGQYLYEFAVVDRGQRKEILRLEEEAKKYIRYGQNKLAAVQLAAIGWKMKNAGYDPPVDVSQPSIDLSAYDEVKEFVTRDDTRKAIHVGDAEFHDKNLVIWYFREDLLNSVGPQLSKMLQLQYRVLLFAGQFDMVVPHEQIDRVIENLDWNFLKEFKKTPTRAWYSNKELAGYVKSFGNLKQVLVRKANHMIVRSQQKWMLDLLGSFAVN